MFSAYANNVSSQTHLEVTKKGFNIIHVTGSEKLSLDSLNAEKQLKN